MAIQTSKTIHQSLLPKRANLLGRLQQRIAVKTARNRFQEAMKIPSYLVEQAFPGIQLERAVIQKAVVTSTSMGNPTHHETILLASLCAYSKPKTVFEFGTYDGLTTLHLAMNTGPDVQIYTIDLPPEDPIRQVITDDTFYTQGVVVGKHFKKAPERDKITQIFCDTTKYDYSSLRGKVDFIFVDAGHAYELIRSDSRNAFEMLKPGGVILWHDYYYPHVGVYTYLNELSATKSLMQFPGTALVCYADSLQK